MAIKFPVPPRREQDQIVCYLDWQVSKINHLIHGYQKQIKLLKERRQTIIDRAATQGINPNVQYKDSGANWIPQIPEHWNMVYSKKLFAQRKDKAFPNDIQLTASQKYGIISQDEFMKREGRRLTVVVTGSDILKHVGIGDFVISMRSFQGGLEYSYVEGKISSAYVRTYNFLSAILPYGSIQWEKLSIFLTLLLPKLPKPEGEDYTEGLLEDVDLESYRAEAQETMRIQLENENGEIAPVPVSTSTGIDVPELDSLTNILKEFHDIFGNIEWTDEDKVKKQINDIIESVRKDERYNNAMQYSDKQNARDESDRAAHEAVLNSMQSGLELFREVQNNPSFRKWLFDSAFNSTYQTNSQQHP